MGNVHKYARKEDVPEKTIFVIVTDGMENSSKMYSADKVRTMIKHEEEKYGWEFMFLTANIDAIETVESYGIRADRTSNFDQSHEGVTEMYECVSDAIFYRRINGTFEEGWNSRLNNK